MSTMKIGQLASSKEKFVPYAAITKWPYRHLYGDQSELVSDQYFAHGKFRAYGWTIYYIHTLLDFYEDKPLLLVPETEVETLFKKIHKELNISCRFPDILRHPGFVVSFEDGHRPRYLGRLTDDCSLIELQNMIPDGLQEEPEVIEDRSFPAFRRKMEAAILAGKNNRKSTKDRRRRDRVETKTSWCAQLRRAQCYFGLRPRGKVDKEAFVGNPNHSYEESRAAQEAYEKASGLKLPELAIRETAPYAFDQDVIFVCVDVEAYERDRNKITEIGISTLDTRDLNTSPPGEGGVEWMKKIRARHFRIAEHGYLRNTEFISGCADNFMERLGISEWITLREAPQVVASCFRHPFSAPGEYSPYPDAPNKVGRHGSGSQYLPPVDNYHPKRNIVLVGHDIKADIEYLRNIGYDVTNSSNLLEAIDTADIFRAMKREQQPRNLGAVLLELELVGWHLHNAGNDAGYTLEALIGICVAALKVTHKRSPDPEQLDAAAAEAEARLIEDLEEWEIADEEGGDGGAAVKLLSYDEMIDKREFDQSMHRANKAEEKRNMKFAKNRTDGGRGRGVGSGGGRNFERIHREYVPSFPGGKGEVKFHATNKQKLREIQNRTPPHLRGNKRETTRGKNGGVPMLDQKTADRLAALDDDDVNEYFSF